MASEPSTPNTATTAGGGHDPGRVSVRNDTATTVCGWCANRFTPAGRQHWCSDRCRQAAWRNRQRTPRPSGVVIIKGDIIYECPQCETRYLNERRCADCNSWCRNIGPGGPCPHCDEPVTITDISNPPTSPATGR